MLTPIASGATVTPLITVGETLPGGYRFEAIPDGVAIYPRGQGRLDVFVNHERPRVPFPYSAANAGTPEANQNDFDNSQLSRLVVNQHSGGILSGKLAIESSENFQRFCSNYLATEKEGFDRDILFTNEEATDFVYRTGEAWPASASDPRAEQAGLVVAYDVKNGKRKPIYGMGRHNHENSVAIPGFEDLVVLSGDDTFSTSSPGSQLYAYIAPNTDAIWNDAGDLWAFESDDARGQRLLRLSGRAPSMAVSGSLHHGAEGHRDRPGRRRSTTSRLTRRSGFPPPPTDGTWQRGPVTHRRRASTGRSGCSTTGASRTRLETALFQFIRIEDIAYDKRPGMENVVYLADSGRARDRHPGTADEVHERPHLQDRARPRSPDQPAARGDLDPHPRGRRRHGQARRRRRGAGNEIHQPDNIETTAHANLLIKEDPSSANQYDLPHGGTRRRPASGG